VVGADDPGRTALADDRPAAVEARSAEPKPNAPYGQTKILAQVQ